MSYEELKPYLNQYKVLVPKKRHYYIETEAQYDALIDYQLERTKNTH